MLFGKILSRVFFLVIYSWTVCNCIRMLIGFVFFAVSTFGYIGLVSTSAHAKVTCPANADFTLDEQNPTICASGFGIPASSGIGIAFKLAAPSRIYFSFFTAGPTISPGTHSTTGACTAVTVGSSANLLAPAVGSGSCTFTTFFTLPGGLTTVTTTRSYAGGVFTTTGNAVITGGAFGAAPVISGGANTTVNAAENQTAVTDVQSTDDSDTEGSGLTYTLTGGADQAKFSIDAGTGVLTFVTAHDFETPTDADGNGIYDVQVTVADSGALTDMQDIAVTVIDVVEAGAPTATSPSVVITGAPSSTDGVISFNITVQFAENVTGFVLADIMVGNGTASGFVAVDGDTYTATISPSGKGDVTINIAANVAVDAAGNGNTAAAQVTVRNTVVEDTQRTVATFMHNRAYHLLANQPKIGGLLNGSNLGGGGSLGNLDVDGNEGNLRLSFASSLSRLRQKSKSGKRIDNAFPVDSASSTYGEARNFDIWTEVYGSSSRVGNAGSDLWVGYFGAHYFVSPDFILGALVQVDWSSETNSNTNTSADGMGWMIGPYIAGRIAGKQLSYEARVAWGRSDNNVTPNGSYTDEFETERFLASAKISGSYKLGSLTMVPEAGVTWFEEDQGAYTDSLGNLIPQQTVSLGEFKFGPSFTYDIKLENGSLLQPSFGISGVQNFGIKQGILTQGAVLGSEDLRARLDAGIAVSNSYGWNLAFSGFYDGVGLANYDAYGGSVKLIVPLN